MHDTRIMDVGDISICTWNGTDWTIGLCDTICKLATSLLRPQCVKRVEILEIHVYRLGTPSPSSMLPVLVLLRFIYTIINIHRRQRNCRVMKGHVL